MPYLSNLQKFDLTLLDFDPDIVVLIAASCQGLRHLIVTCEVDEYLRLNDASFEPFPKSAPGLRYLRLNGISPLTVQALRTLGEDCRRLESCWIFGDFNLADLGTTGDPLFPVLNEGRLGAMMNYSGDAIGAVLRHHVPLVAGRWSRNL